MKTIMYLSFVLASLTLSSSAKAALSCISSPTQNDVRLELRLLAHHSQGYMAHIRSVSEKDGSVKGVGTFRVTVTASDDGQTIHLQGPDFLMDLTKTNLAGWEWTGPLNITTSDAAVIQANMVCRRG